jgi:hypothetical protein
MYAQQPARRNRHHTLTIATLAALIGACAEHPVAVNTNSGSANDRTLLQVSVTPLSSRLELGDTLMLRAEIRDRYGNPVQDLVPAWETNATAVVIVSPDGTHARVIAIGAGEARVTARVGDAAAAASLSVAAGNTPPQL